MKLNKLLTVAVISIGLASTAAMAGQGSHHKHGERGMLSERMITHLQLSEQQQTQIKAIMDANKQLKPQRGSRHESHQALQALTNTSDSFDEQAAREIIQAQQSKQLERKIAHLKSRHQVWNILTEEQQQKWARAKVKHQERRGHKRDGDK
ncbi:Spy/CpxP family protein refolding chaperone [Pseudoalteromonas sp. BDTF-M6]|uniref:Spy/CpxP family protein refolding chaperone n=1 Tax=Pseudoalteromonas sp. BDTF-M6 TaxID=2796132 RepID=UPI001BAE9B57|nr:Spy/CpxP family protein refolding chaperone [Pseudoalteromonas sp. BDTF-M6]MBS3797437.1 Spy/CpxP family protein refolding chaperone [Pseudoalteromonas sp. BDTF-M6]